VSSQDLDELLRITDRIAVLNAGRLTKPAPTREVTLEALGLLMGGVHGAVADTGVPVRAHAG
jgi:simple sugar transport system ATP-binding protein